MAEMGGGGGIMGATLYSWKMTKRGKLRIRCHALSFRHAS